MFFGLTNRPATFQTMMNDIFRDLSAQGVVCVYLDDILIYTKTLEEHRRITRIILDRLYEHRLFLKPKKCEFERTEIEYLRLIISHGTASMDPVKVARVGGADTQEEREAVQEELGHAVHADHTKCRYCGTRADCRGCWDGQGEGQRHGEQGAEEGDEGTGQGG
ncbi:putative retrotransposable element tf2 155 kda protein type 1-like [Lyophyllum shimeji]|uniref:Retrotransposable element tf2 155 kDa protein type 1-like n=1 Tax=Lyophyllum shimeji TaxID=47721 RepID=A0A9P3PXS9_LYOSH|nr:putative retrotransposable element tf2 155 kda protein type 1-like [Lyophyllum shimeji]